MKRAFVIFVHVALGLALSACASIAAKRAEFRARESANYVVPEEYQNYTCAQLKEEAERAADRTFEHDEVSYFGFISAFTIVGLPTAWYAISSSPAYDDARGNLVEKDTLVKVSIKKNCAWSARHEWPWRRH
jgi:hypothetical protein